MTIPPSYNVKLTIANITYTKVTSCQSFSNVSTNRITHLVIWLLPNRNVTFWVIYKLNCTILSLIKITCSNRLSGLCLVFTQGVNIELWTTRADKGFFWCTRILLHKQYLITFTLVFECMPAPV